MPATPALVSGMYTNSQHTSGVAFFVDAEASWDPWTIVWATFADGPGPYFGLLRHTHMWNAYWGLAPGQTKTLRTFTMIGSWSNAIDFALSSP